MVISEGRLFKKWSARSWFLCLILACLAVGGISGTTGYFIGARSAEATQPADDTAEMVEDPMWFVNTELDTTGYRQLYNDVVFDYSDVLEGEEIVTVATVDYTMPGKLYAQTQVGSGSIGFEFDSKKVPLEVKSGDVITIAGVMSADRRHGTTMKHCEIIGFGEIAKDLKSDADNQRSQLEPLRPEPDVEDGDSDTLSQLSAICWSIPSAFRSISQSVSE